MVRDDMFVFTSSVLLDAQTRHGSAHAGRRQSGGYDESAWERKRGHDDNPNRARKKGMHSSASPSMAQPMKPMTRDIKRSASEETLEAARAVLPTLRPWHRWTVHPRGKASLRLSSSVQTHVTAPLDRCAP